MSNEKQDAPAGPFRVGRRVRRNVYRFNEPILMAANESEAVWLVALLNAGEAVLFAGRKPTLPSEG